MFDGLIDDTMSKAILTSVVACKQEDIQEIRLRIGKPRVVRAKNRTFQIRHLQKPYTVTKTDIDGIVLRASNMSIYSVNDQLTKGYISCKGGIRLGVAGEGVVERDKVITVKNIGCVVVRIPHQVKHVADGIIDSVLRPSIKNVLVVSPPCGGKTTLLRELARLTSINHNVVMIDERFELSAQSGGVAGLDVGNCEIVTGLKKTYAYENCIRAMNPDVIVTDELFKHDEVEAVCDIVRSGVRVFASLHGESVADVAKSDVFSQLLSVFDLAVVLSKNPVGQIVDKVLLNKQGEI